MISTEEKSCDHFAESDVKQIETSSDKIETIDVAAHLALVNANGPSTSVERFLPVSIDLEHLALFDSNELDVIPAPVSGLNVLPSNVSYDSNFERAMGLQARGNVQLLVNSLMSLDKRVTEESVFLQLPFHTKVTKTVHIPSSNGAAVFAFPSIELPREKPVPKPQAATKWERFAAEKGILNNKRSRMVFDETSEEYKPRFGFKSAKTDPLADWAIPVKKGDDPMADPFAARDEEKNKHIDKNRKRQRKNLGLPKNVKVNKDAINNESNNRNKKIRKINTKENIGAMKNEDTHKSKFSTVTNKQESHVARKLLVQRDLHLSKRSTASAGKFDPPIKGDVNIKRGKRKFAPVA